MTPAAVTHIDASESHFKLCLLRMYVQLRYFLNCLHLYISVMIVFRRQTRLTIFRSHHTWNIYLHLSMKFLLHSRCCLFYRNINYFVFFRVELKILFVFHCLRYGVQIIVYGYVYFIFFLSSLKDETSIGNARKLNQLYNAWNSNKSKRPSFIPKPNISKEK